ncbi:MAG: dihydroneopterin aldolase [Bacteroidota bacterium]
MNTRVSLRGIKFYAFHGYYEFERRVGNNFELDVDVVFAMTGDPNDQIDKTINYEEIYRICESYMQKKYLLLESVAHDIASEIRGNYSNIKSVEVTLSKLKPPVGGKVDKAVVSIQL